MWLVQPAVIMYRMWLVQPAVIVSALEFIFFQKHIYIYISEY